MYLIYRSAVVFTVSENRTAGESFVYTRIPNAFIIFRYTHVYVCAILCVPPCIYRLSRDFRVRTRVLQQDVYVMYIILYCVHGNYYWIAQRASFHSSRDIHAYDIGVIDCNVRLVVRCVGYTRQNIVTASPSPLGKCRRIHAERIKQINVMTTDL